MHDPRLDTAVELSMLADERVTVALLANCAGLSVPRFSHLFARQTGMLPGEHLRLMKQFHHERRVAVQVLGAALHAGSPPSGTYLQNRQYAGRPPERQHSASHRAPHDGIMASS